MSNLPKVYTVHFKLFGVNDLIDSLIEDTYAPALKWLRKQTAHDNVDFAKSMNRTLANVEELQRKTTVKKNDSDSSVLFIFEIEHFTDAFAEQDSQGIRPWLRNYIDDFFHQSTMIHLLRVQLLDRQDSLQKNEIYNRIFEAFTQALEKAYAPKTDTFWIDNELDFPMPAVEMQP